MFYTVLVVLLMCLQGLTANEDGNLDDEKVVRAFNEFQMTLRELEEAGDLAEEFTLERERKGVILNTAVKVFCKVVNALKREISEETLTKQRGFSLLGAAKAVCQAPTVGQAILNAARYVCQSVNGKKREEHSSNELTEEISHQQDRRGLLDNAVKIFCKAVNKRDARSVDDPAEEFEFQLNKREFEKALQI